LRRLAETVGEATHPGENVGWREVMFGRKESGAEREGKEELERRELETGALRPPPSLSFSSPCQATGTATYRDLPRRTFSPK
jgi:hypothetical protein